MRFLVPTHPNESIDFSGGCTRLSNGHADYVQRTHMPNNSLGYFSNIFAGFSLGICSMWVTKPAETVMQTRFLCKVYFGA